jgi:hypothetical protein
VIKIAKVAGVSALLLAGSVEAQNLEQTYAQMCTEAKKSSETCTALRKALIEKLSGESMPGRGSKPAAVSAAAKTPLTKAEKAKLAAKWGKWAELVGKSYDTGEALYSYSWGEPYQALVTDVDSPDGHRQGGLVLQGDAIVASNSEKSEMLALSPTEYVEKAGADQRYRYVFVENGSDVYTEKLVDGQWVPQGEPLKRRLVPAAKVASVKSRIMTARMQKDQVIAQHWGGLDKLIGRRFVTALPTTTTAEEVLYIWEWQKRGESALLRSYFLPSKKIQNHVVVERAPTSGQFILKDYKGNPVGTATAAAGKFDTKYSTGPIMHSYSWADGNVVLSQTSSDPKEAAAKKGSWALQDVTKMATDDIVQQASNRLAARKTAVANAQVQKARAAERARQEARAEAQAKASRGGGGGGFLGALGGAMLGAMAGGDTSQILGAAAKGAAIVDPNSEMAGALNTVGDSMITGNSAGLDNAIAANLGSAAGLSGGGGARHTSPVPMPGCDAVNVNADNYRSAALSGGNDVQLKTLCGAAYEYWWMYNNAFKQGYSAADAEITYTEHSKAAAVVNQFWNETKAGQ